MDARTLVPSAPSDFERDDRWDEVWEGVLFVSPIPNVEHQRIGTRLSRAFLEAIEDDGLGMVLHGTNVSDRGQGWVQNYRCPDIAVYLVGNPSRDWNTHWEGGPDFAVEIVSPADRSREKLDFYAKVGVRELLVIDRKPWRLELYRLGDGVLTSAGSIEPGQANLLDSEVLPLKLRLDAGTPRPTIAVIHDDGLRRWTV
ncbi:Uma2 family endonuclease [Tundrisphaera sp. TA3]|uniref:Uma2 family endonuclease n=1 Tax=Tundrisphaera sp. TA3 TaxID=3435775 RepID=UPI003EBBB5BA